MIIEMHFIGLVSSFWLLFKLLNFTLAFVLLKYRLQIKKKGFVKVCISIKLFVSSVLCAFHYAWIGISTVLWCLIMASILGHLFGFLLGSWALWAIRYILQGFRKLNQEEEAAIPLYQSTTSDDLSEKVIEDGGDATKLYRKGPWGWWFYCPHWCLEQGYKF